MIWLIIAAIAGAGAIAAASSSSSSSSPGGSKGKAGSGGNPFGKPSDYSDPINQASSDLKDAGEQARAKSEAQGKKDFRKWAAIVGGPQGGADADEIYNLGIDIAHLIYGDEYDRANTDDQKARLNADVGQAINKGFPPAGLIPHADFGARDVADRIEQMFSAMTQADLSGGEPASTEIGNAAIYSVVNGSPEVQKTIRDIFDRYSKPVAEDNYTSGGGTLWTSTNAPTYLIDAKRSDHVPGKLGGLGLPLVPGDRPELEYVAAAAAGLYGAPLNDAIAIAYKAANTYALRRGLTKREDFLVGYSQERRDPQIKEADARWLGINGQADSMADAWRALKLAYDHQYQQDRKDAAAKLATAAAGGIKLPHL